VRRRLVSLSLCVGVACGGEPALEPSETAAADTPATTPPTSGTSSTTATTTGDPDIPPDTDGPPACALDGTCNLLDVLIVVDNSSSMGEEQRNLAAGFPYLIAKLRALRDAQGNPIDADVQIMVTTSDMGYPACAEHYKDDYTPAKGAPIVSACVDRLARFTSTTEPVVSIPEACTDGCTPASAAMPTGPFIHFTPTNDNIFDPDGMGDPVADALACIGPQGIDGCDSEGTLEAMLQALSPERPWNQGAQPFLREGGVLAIVLMTDEDDCAIEGAKYFDPANAADPQVTQYWEDLPGMPGVKGEPTSAVCWNGGTDCPDADMNGEYECVPADRGVLQPLDRYTDFLGGVLAHQYDKQVMMLGILGVPPVTAHSPDPPYEPVDGGVFDLVYRDWLAADILPGDPASAADKQYEYGIGPGCSDAATGQATPAVRIRAVCESLNGVDDPNTPADEHSVRCCMESICDDDLTGAIDCLAGGMQSVLRPAG